jgi:hypothetical protein
MPIKFTAAPADKITNSEQVFKHFQIRHVEFQTN